MTDFVIKLAEVPIGVRVLHESVKDFCADYLVEEPAEEHIYITEADIEAERALSALQNERDGVPVRSYSDAYLESLALYRKIADTMLVHDTVVFHGCVIAAAGKAYLFTAPSGTGKTTHARYWLRMIPDTHILNGDKPLLRITNDGVLACGTPWRGKERMGCNECLPLAGLCILSRDTHDHIEAIDLHDAMDALLSQVHHPSRPETLVRSLELVGKLGEKVPLYSMGCTLDENAALVSHAMMAAKPQV